MPELNPTIADRILEMTGPDETTLVVAEWWTDVPLLLDELLDASGVDRVYRAHGRQRVELEHGGRILFTTPHSTGGRGITAHQIVLLPGVTLSPEHTADLVPALAPTGGALVKLDA